MNFRKKNSLTNTNYNIILYYLEEFCPNVQIFGRNTYIWVMQMVFSKVHPACQFYKKLCLCARLFICALWSPAGKGLTSWLSFVVSTVSLSLSHWYPGSGVVLDCIDS